MDALDSLFNSISSIHPTGTSRGAGAATTGATAGSTSGRTGTEGREGDRKQETWEISVQIPSVLKIFLKICYIISIVRLSAPEMRKTRTFAF